MTDKQVIGFYDCVFFDEVEIEKCNGLIIKTTNKKEFTSHRELKKKARNNDSSTTYNNNICVSLFK